MKSTSTKTLTTNLATDVQAISVGYPLGYPLRRVIYPLGLQILLIGELALSSLKRARNVNNGFVCMGALVWGLCGAQNGKTGKGECFLWDLHKLEKKRNFRGHNAIINAIDVNGNILCSASDDCTAKIWDVR